ncbi:MAG: DNA mismatch repair protein MutS, partial [Bacteroidota bacterium]
MAQYNQVKAKYPEALLLFRVGDFYETFGSDAVSV